MSTSTISIKDREIAAEIEDACKIVVFYENTPARVGAMSVCDRLVDQFAEDLDFEFRWWKFKRLGDTNLRGQIMEFALKADIVMFCPQGAGLSEEASEWLEAWAESGVNSDGAIALVVPANVDPEGGTAKLSPGFKWAAKRLGMDFLQVSVPMISSDAGSRPAQAAVGTSADSLQHQHWGLNE